MRQDGVVCILLYVLVSGVGWDGVVSGSTQVRIKPVLGGLGDLGRVGFGVGEK